MTKNDIMIYAKNSITCVFHTCLTRPCKYFKYLKIQNIFLLMDIEEVMIGYISVLFKNVTEIVKGILFMSAAIYLFKLLLFYLHFFPLFFLNNFFSFFWKRTISLTFASQKSTNSKGLQLTEWKPWLIISREHPA